jgi:hypothetical protein
VFRLTEQNQILGRRVEYSVGYPITDKLRHSIGRAVLEARHAKQVVRYSRAWS